MCSDETDLISHPLCASHQRRLPSLSPLTNWSPRLFQATAKIAWLDIPEPDGVIKAATGHGTSIRAPGQSTYMVRMPLKGTETASAGHIPEPDGRIICATGEPLAIGGKGQAFDEVGMPSFPQQRATLNIPQFDRPIRAIQKYTRMLR
jgi:hypothetical protein